MRIAVTCLVCVLAVAIGRAQQEQDVAAAPGAAPTSESVVDRFLTAADAPLVSYRAVRHLRAAARGGRMRAELKAETTLDREKGFQYVILEESGSGVIRSKVLKAALEAERRARNEGEGARAALTRANYEFSLGDITPEGLIRVGLRPLRQDTMLIDGSMLLTGADADLVSVQGRLVKRPSFWTRKVEVVRRYARIAGIRVPVSMDSNADVLIAGKSTFSMEYQYESINGEPLPDQGTAASR
jgi:hypothetical protein